jgi:hypothetical protein
MTSGENKMNASDFAAQTQDFLEAQSQYVKYRSDDNIKAIVGRMKQYGLSVCSDTLVKRAADELIAEKKIQRSDGADEQIDRLAAAMATRKHLEQIGAAPISEREFDSFVRLTLDELERRYWGSDAAAAEFRARYDRAVRDHGFRVPPKPATAQTDVPVEADQSKWRSLDAKTYWTLDTTTVRRLYGTDAGFRRAVDRLIAKGLI